MSSSAIRAGAAYVEVLLRDSKYIRGLAKVQRSLRAFGASAMAYGRTLATTSGLFLAPMFAAVKSFAKAGDTLDKMSARVGASVEFLSALSHAAEIGGADISAMEVGIRRLQRSAYDATRGLSTATDAFGELGVTVTDAGGSLKSTETLFMESAAALSAIQDETKKAALAMVLFGRSGTSLLPMLKDGKAGLLAMMQEARDLGIVMSKEDATAAAEVTDALTRMTGRVKFAVYAVGSALVPAMKDGAAVVSDLAHRIREFIRANREWLDTIFRAAILVGAAGGALIVFGATVKLVAFGLGGLASLLGVIGTGFSLIAAVVAALVSPVGLLVTGVAALGAYLLHTSGAGAKALDWLGQRFAALKETAVAAWGAIGKALAAGDLAAASKVLWAALRVSWLQGTMELREYWYALRDAVVNTWTGAQNSIAGIILVGIGAIKKGWSSLTTFLANTWTNFVTLVKIGWIEAVAAAQIAWARTQGILRGEGDMNDPLVKAIGANAYQDRKAAERAAADAIAKRNAENARYGQQTDIETADALGILDKGYADAAKRRAQASADALAAAQKDLEDAQKEFAGAIGDASALPGLENGGPAGAGPAEIAKLAGAALGGAAGRIQGTFSGYAAGRQGGAARWAERTAKGVEKMQKDTARLLQEIIRNGGNVQLA